MKKKKLIVTLFKRALAKIFNYGIKSTKLEY